MTNRDLPRADGDPPPPHDDDHPEVAAANARAGLVLFAIYLLLYGGFVGLSAFAPGLMRRNPGGGVNVALLYGMALIFSAMILAFVYMGACRRIAGRHGRAEKGRAR